MPQPLNALQTKEINTIRFHPLQGKWCKELGVDQMRRHLDQETDLEADAPEVVLDQREEHMAVSDKRLGHGDEKVEPRGRRRVNSIDV